MPELPEVESTRRALQRRLAGFRIVEVIQRREGLRFPFPPDLRERLVGRSVGGFRRRAKYLIWDLDDGGRALAHLGMSGRLSLSCAPLEKHEHLTFAFQAPAGEASAGAQRLKFVDPRRFGSFDWIESEAALEAHPRFARLGLEPLDPEFDGPALSRAIGDRSTVVKIALMDQRAVVGVGNIYASESLHRAGLSPERPANAISKDEFARLAAAVRAVLLEAIDAGGSSLRDYASADGTLGNFQSAFSVYGKEGAPCPRCGSPIKRTKIAQRASYHCDGCQS